MTFRRIKFFLKNYLWAKVQSEQVGFQSATEDVLSFCCPDGELVPPLWSQDNGEKTTNLLPMVLKDFVNTIGTNLPVTESRGGEMRWERGVTQKQNDVEMGTDGVSSRDTGIGILICLKS